MYTCGLKQYRFKDYLVPVFVGCGLGSIVGCDFVSRKGTGCIMLTCKTKTTHLLYYCVREKLF
jgi:hypothetical protein